MTLIGGEDYVVHNSSLISFPNPSRSNTQICIPIVILDENIVELNESFSVAISTSHNIAPSGPLTITIINDDSKCLQKLIQTLQEML